MALRTPLYDAHLRLGARVVEFAGWDMPVQYSGLIEEHEAVRGAVGLFDVSHMGEVIFRGPKALAALQAVFTNDLSKVVDGQAQYGCLCRDDGGIVDDVVIYRRSAEDFLVCVNAGNRQKDFQWLAAHAGGADVRNESDDWGQVALQGPLAVAVLKKLTRLDLDAIKTYRHAPGTVAGVAGLVARTGYTGEDGFEIFCPAAQTEKVWNALLEAGAPEGIRPAGLGCRDTLRLEMAYRLYGSDMDDATSPLEAGLGWVVKLDKGEFVGRAALQRQKAQGLTRTLAGFRLEEAGIARHGYDALHGGQKVGVVTSGTRSPTLKTSIGLAYLPPSLAAEGSRFSVEIRGKPVAAVVVKTPFLSRKAS